MTIIISIVACVVCFLLGIWLGGLRSVELFTILVNRDSKQDEVIKKQDEMITCLKEMLEVK